MSIYFSLPPYQTESGKTFTITGGAEHYADRGIIPRTLSYLLQQYQKVQSGDTRWHVSLHCNIMVSAWVKAGRQWHKWEDISAHISTTKVSFSTITVCFRSVHDSDHKGVVRIFVGLSCKLWCLIWLFPLRFTSLLIPGNGKYTSWLEMDRVLRNVFHHVPCKWPLKIVYTSY